MLVRPHALLFLLLILTFILIIVFFFAFSSLFLLFFAFFLLLLLLLPPLLSGRKRSTKSPLAHFQLTFSPLPVLFRSILGSSLHIHLPRLSAFFDLSIVNRSLFALL
jgi:hypothetical protein